MISLLDEVEDEVDFDQNQDNNDEYEDNYPPLPPRPLFHLNPRLEPPTIVHHGGNSQFNNQQQQCSIVGALARRQDLDWEEVNGDNGQQDSDDEDEGDYQQEPVYVAPRPEAPRVLRSATIAAATLLDCNHDAPLAEEEVVVAVPPPSALCLACAKVNLHDAVDEQHRQLLDAYNESVENLSRLRAYLAKHPEQDGSSVYVHLCEEAVILQSDAELRYLRTSNAYQAIDPVSGLRDAYVHKPIPPAVRKSHRAKIIKGKTVGPGRDEHGKWPMSELVGEWIEAALKEEKDQRFPVDAVFPLQGDADLLPGQSTLSEFLRDLEGTCAMHNIPHNGKMAVLDWIARHVPGLRTGTRVSKAGNNVHDFYKYLLTDWRHAPIDACPNNCMLYVGENRWKIKCPCGEYRFSKCCNNGKCTQGGIDCDPFETPTHSQRSSYQVVMYRYYLSTCRL